MSERSYGVAGDNLRPVVPLILQRTGLPAMVDGTLNVQLPSPYIVDRPTAIIAEHEYPAGLGIEHIKLQRCVIAGLKAVIMRPNTHEPPHNAAHGPSHIELLSAYHLRSTLRLATNSLVSVEVGGDEEWWSAAK